MTATLKKDIESHQGPRVPEAYVAQGKDIEGSRSSERVSVGENTGLSPEAMSRIEKAGLIIAAAAVTIGSLVLLSKSENPDPAPANPSGIMTSGNESE